MDSLDKKSAFVFTAPLNEKQLAGKRILITGGASGIGAGCARLFAAHGSHVIIADLNEELGRALVAELGGSGGSVNFIRVDVSSFESQKTMFAAALDLLPGREIDVLIPCAVVGSGFWDYTPLHPDALRTNSALEPTTKTFQVGLVGTYYSALICAKYCMGLHVPSSQKESLPYDKSIILVGSLASYGPLPGSPEYTSVKWGVRGLFRSLRVEMLQTGVRVNMLAPTFIETPLTAAQLPMLKKAGVPFAKVEDVAGVVGRLVVGRGVNGRALAIMAEQVIDLGDDHEGKNAGNILQAMIESGLLKAPLSFNIPKPHL
ncbi:hypothetical protein BKA65DRAFT_471358 [Rhexocercosporidium sp. MPI-PUGE-AT-0058]|nr:hypothetical protein BKA65DRAFT_471358 [Rhexocercosporidium sp. MPI-PUGE-AT-0058]